jgi:glycosyltransferase involved in cell wall biosynthesis
VVPNYNHARYLPECLGSIAAQMRPADEVVIIDDGSSDDSPQVLDQLVRGHPTWRVIRHRERRGVIARLNEGLAEATGDWVAFLGADDGLLPTFVERTSQYAAKYPDAGLVSACATVLEGTSTRSFRPVILPRTDPGYVSVAQFRKMLRTGDNFFLGTVTLYRREALTSLGGFDPAVGALSDGFIARRLAVRLGFSFLPEILGYWRIHDNNYSVTTATDAVAVERLLSRARDVLGSEPPGLFPPNYELTLGRRVRFGGIRLLTLDQSTAPATRAARIAELLHAGAAERRVLRAMMSSGRAGTFAALAWFSLRLWPFSLFRLGLEPFRRRAVLASATNIRSVGMLPARNRQS